MNPTLTEVLDAALALSRSERAEVAQELIATLENTNEYDEARYTQLRAAVAVGLNQIKQGESIRIPAGELNDYLDRLSQEATERVARKSALATKSTSLRLHVPILSMRSAGRWKTLAKESEMATTH